MANHRPKFCRTESPPPDTDSPLPAEWCTTGHNSEPTTRKVPDPSLRVSDLMEGVAEAPDTQNETSINPPTSAGAQIQRGL